MDEVEPITAARALGAALRQHRMAKGMSLRALAKRVGLGAHGTLIDYEYGRRIPPEDLVVACEKALDLDDGTLRELLREALAERADTQAAKLLTPSPPSAAAVAPQSVAPRRRSRRRWWGGISAVLVTVLVVSVGVALLADRHSAGETPTDPGSGSLRFGFENPADDWVIMWGTHKATAEVTDDLYFEGHHSFQVRATGSSAEGSGSNNGYVAFGTTHGLESLHAGMRVTMHLWTSYRKDGFLFMVYGKNSQKVNAPETPDDGSEISPVYGPDGWGTVRWTVPNVSEVRAIIVQPYQRDSVPRLIAVDAVSW